MEDNAIQTEKDFDTEIIHIILEIPKETVRLKVDATLLDESGTPYDVFMTMNPSEIREARQDFLENVGLGDDYDGYFVLTDKGREMLENDSACSDIWEDT